MDVPLKNKWNKRIKDSWKSFLRGEESELIEKLSPSSKEAKMIKKRCYTRNYYSDPDNLKMQYQRNKNYRQVKKEDKKQALVQDIPTLLEQRKEDAKLKREISNKKALLTLKEKMKDPELAESIRKKSQENGRKYREAHKGYRKVNYLVRKKGILPLSEKGLLRKDVIKNRIQSYSQLKEFKESHLKDYKWAIANGLGDELFMPFTDYSIGQTGKTGKIARREEIEKTIKAYKTSGEFRKACPKDYAWIMANELGDELMSGFSDVIKRKVSKVEREEGKRPNEALIRSIERSAKKCKTMEEFSTRFKRNYDLSITMGILDQIIELID